MTEQRAWRRPAGVLVVGALAALWLGGCGEAPPVVAVPIGPEPVPLSIGDVVTRAKAGEGDWQLIWAVRQSRRAMPLTAADIGRLREAGVSERVMDFMLETVTATRLYSFVPMTVEEVIGLVQAGIPDDQIVAEISQTGTIFHLRAADVFALREAGVSDEVIDFMLYTRQLESLPPRWAVEYDSL